MSSPAPQPSSILIVDERRLYAEAVGSVLKDFGMNVAGIGHDLESTLSIMEKARIDVVLLSVTVGGEGQQQAVDLIKRRRPDVSVVALVERDPGTSAEQRDLARFDSHIRRDASVSMFVDVVQEALKERRPIVPPEAGGEAETDPDGEAPVLAGRPLTPREWDVLVLMVEGISNKGIAERLGVGPSTVNTHVQSVLSKLRAHSRLEAAAFALNEGLVAIGDDGAFRRPSGSR
jgi:two-component system, NarL family, nitrate/nitrite response regulator NarL